MPRTRPPYPPEFRRQIVELVRAGRSMRELAEEFEPSYETIREWVRQANRDEGLDLSGPTTDEKEELRRLRRENHRAPAGAGDLGKSRGLTLWEPGSVQRKRTDSWASTRRGTPWPRCAVCSLVSPSGYYAWLGRWPSRRAREDVELRERIEGIHARSRGTYGAPRIHAELRANGIRVGRKRVARLMREAGLVGVSRRRKTKTTQRDPEAQAAPDLVEREFTSPAPDRLWVADITYVPTGSGFLYLAVVVDAFSRKVVGWAMEGHLKAELVVGALNMALWQRRPTGVIHHSDQGRQYTSVEFGKRCREAGIRPSMGSVGDCYDNALCESFFATLECELLDRVTLKNHAEARRALFAYIEGWYNPHRRHSALGYESPVGYERRYGERRAWERTEQGEAEHVAAGAGTGTTCDRDEP